jgi:hypothetical protein
VEEGVFSADVALGTHHGSWELHFENMTRGCGANSNGTMEFATYKAVSSKDQVIDDGRQSSSDVLAINSNKACKGCAIDPVQ